MRLKQQIIIKCILEFKTKLVRHQLQAFCYFFSNYSVRLKSSFSLSIATLPRKEFVCCNQTTSYNFSFSLLLLILHVEFGFGFSWAAIECWASRISRCHSPVTMISSKTTSLCVKPGFFPMCITLYLSVQFSVAFYCSRTKSCKIFLWFFATCPSLYVCRLAGFAGFLSLLLLPLSMLCNTFFLFNCLLVSIEKQEAKYWNEWDFETWVQI